MSLIIRTVVVVVFFFLWLVFCILFFFFSSRRRHTRSLCDWSSDVCSSDLWLDHEKTRNGLGLTADYRHLLTKQDQLGVSAGAMRYRFIPDALQANDFNLYQLALGWLRGAADGSGAFGLAVLAGRENATNSRPDGDKPFLGARLTAQIALSEK